MDPRFFRKYADLVTEAEQDTNEGWVGNALSKLNWDSGDIKDTQPDGDIAVKQDIAKNPVPSKAEMNSPEYRQKIIADLTARAKAGDKGAAASLAALQRSQVSK